MTQSVKGRYPQIGMLLTLIALILPLGVWGAFPDARFDSYVPITVYIATGLLAISLSLGNKPLGASPRMAELCACAILAGLLVAAVWMIVSTGASTRFTSFAIFQHGDATDFYDTAAKLLTIGWFDTPRGRPFVNAIWAGSLDWFSFDLGRVFFYASLLAGLGIALVVNRLGQLVGTGAALIGGAILADYVLEFIVGTSSELPGFIVGLASAALLIDGVVTGKRWTFFLGFAALCATMVVRPGALFLLPILLIYGWRFFPIGKLPKPVTPIILLAIWAGVFMGNGQIAQVVTPNSGGSFVNAADSWYAIFAQGREALGITPGSEIRDTTLWRQIYDDHPDIEALPQREQASRKMEIILDQVATYPLAGLTGVLLEYKLLLGEAKLFRFIEIKPIRYLVLVLFFVGGIVAAKRFWKDPRSGFVFCSFAATLVSIPFMHGAESRGFAGSVALLVVVVMFGGHALFRLVRSKLTDKGQQIEPPSEPDGIFDNAVPVLAGILATCLLATGASGLTKAGTLSSTPEPPSCGNGQIPDLIIGARGVTVFLNEGGETHAFADPRMELSELQRLVEQTDKLVLEKSRIRYRLRHLNREQSEQLESIASTKNAPVSMVQAISPLSRSVKTYFLVGGLPSKAIGTTLPICTRIENGLTLGRIAG